jgi:heptosyltransferase-2
LHEVFPAPPEWGRRRLVSRERFVLRLVENVLAEPRPADALGDDAALRLELGVTEAEAARLETVLDAKGPATPGGPLVVLAPGASFGPSKCWPAEYYAALGDRLAGQGHRVVVVGGPGESERLRAVIGAMSSHPIVLDDCLDLGALKALLERADLLVANDAGARHIAAAFSVPSVIFFGPTSVAKTADHLDAIEILETDQACRPCYARECPIDHRCLREIDVDRAEAAAARGLARNPEGRRIESAVSIADPIGQRVVRSMDGAAI